MSKKEVGKRPIKGRLWGASYSLSEKNKLTLECVPHEDTQLKNELREAGIRSKEIQVTDQNTGKTRTVAEVFFFNFSDWFKGLNNRIKRAFDDKRHQIRTGLNLFTGEITRAAPPPVVVIDAAELINL